jgi:hypothetical protein
MIATHSEEHQHSPGPFNPTTAAGALQGRDQTDWPTTDEEACVALPVEFAYSWEEEFARMLDEYEISWQYKPRTFAVEWDEEGNFVDSFTPDFYLPVSDVFVELAAPDCSASVAKARKVRLLRQQHPEITIELNERSRDSFAAELYVQKTSST